MPVYRYKRTGINVDKIKGQVPPADASSVSLGDIASTVVLDINALATSKDDLDDFMDAQGWAFDSTDPSGTVEEQASGDIVHQDLSGAGTNTHAQLDTHVASTSNPHSVTFSQANASPIIYDAVVAPSGGDYTSVKAAFDAGANSVFVRTGTYTESATITLPSTGALLHGEDGAVIDLTGTARIEVDGSGGTQETAGTISVATDATTVTGVGTTFTNLSAGDWIRLGKTWLEIDTITNNTALELVSAWRGDALSGESYVAQSMAIDVSIHRIHVLGGNNGCLYIRACVGFTVSESKFRQSAVGAGITIVSSYGGHLEQSFFNSNVGGGCVVTDCSELTVDGSCHFDNNDTDGLLINGDSSHLVIANSSCTNNDGDGVSVEGTSEEIVVSNMICDLNDGKGINTESTTSLIAVTACVVEDNGGVGIDFDGSGNVIAGCTVAGGASAGIWPGDDGVISSCHIENNTGDGINVQGDDNTIISNNIIKSNGAGIVITNTDDLVVSGNHIYDNTGVGISIPATGVERAHLTDNYVEGNGTNYSITAGAGATTTVWGDTHDGAGITGPVRCFVGTTDPGIGDDVADGFMPGSQWTNTTGDSVWICVDNSSGAAVWVDVSVDALSAVPHKMFQSDQMESPNSSDWAVNALAPLIPDANNLALSVRAFDDSAEEGIGFTARVPTGATNMILGFLGRAATAPSVSPDTVALNLYSRAVPDNATIPSWSTETSLTDISIPTNVYYQKDSQTIAISTLGLTAGVTYTFELTRDFDDGDDLTGDWLLHSLTVGWS